MWLDTGRPLSRHVPGPWATSSGRARQAPYQSCSFYPTIQVKPSVALQPQKYMLEPPLQEQHDLSQSASILYVKYGKTLEPNTTSNDPFYALNEVFWFVASSYRQYLNMLEKKDAIRTKTSLRGDQTVQENPKPQEWDSTNIRYDRAILEGHIVSLQGIIHTIRHRGVVPPNPTDKHAWPRARDRDQADRALDAAKQLEKTFETLLQQAEQLLTRYRDGMNVLMNRASMAEANKSLAQAKEVAKLTRLAFVYIPLSFTASFFGMNLSPLNTTSSTGGGRGELQLWVWFVVSSPVLLFSLMLMKWDIREMLNWCKGICLWAFGRLRLQKHELEKTKNGAGGNYGVAV